jgi:predicted adenine nucleotide alpha hydrolase (AANH) superfamily ATPase
MQDMATGKSKLLLHVCCAPCGGYVSRLLSAGYDVVLYFYNPNIQPRKEYERRLAEVRRYAEDMGLELEVGEYDEGGWLEAMRGHEDDPEGAERCRLCYRFRLEELAKEAERLGCRYLATTLTVSPHKKADAINPEGRAAVAQTSVEFVEDDFKKKGGYEESCRLSREYGFYRQQYCGCLFGRRDRKDKRR